jgi:uncharacterized protein (TIGR02099 family)
MRATTRNILRRIWYTCWIFAASFLIMLALAFSAIRLMLPLATDYKVDIENLVSRQLGLQAQISSIDTDWRWFKPRLKLIGVRLGAAGSELFAAEEIILAMNPFSSIVKRRVEIDEVTVVRTNFSLRRDQAGLFYAQGFALPRSTEMVLSVPPFLHDRTLRVIDSAAALVDDKSGMDYRLEAVNLTVQTGQREHRAYLSVLLPEEIGERFEAGVELRGDLQDLPNLRGRLYVQAASVELPAVLQKTRYRDSIRAGQLDVALWAELDSDARRELQGNVNLKGFAGDFAGLPLLSGFEPPFDSLSADFRAQLAGTELELELENLLLARGDDVAPLNGLALKTSVDGAMAGGEIMIDHLRLKDVWPLAAQHPRLREALHTAGIQGVSGNILRFYGRWDIGTGDIALVSRFEELGISGSAQTPSVSALRGKVRLLNKTAVAELETVGSQVDYPRLFRNKLELRNLSGAIFVRYADSGLTLATRNLFLQTPHIVSRHWFDLIFTQGRAPYANIYTTFEDGDIKAAGQYYPVSIMSEKLVAWLEAAVIDGRLASGDMELQGPLEKYPFRNQEGIFRIDADFDGMELNYFNDWPHLQQARLHARFFGATLAIAIHEGEFSGLDIVGADAWITDFRNSWLIAQVPVYGVLAGTVDYLRGSGLRKSFDPLIDQVEATGMHAGFLRLDIPLYQGPEALWYLKSSIFDGGVLFRDAGLKFTQINSDLLIDHDSLYAEPFGTSLNGHPLLAAIDTFAEAGGNTARIALDGDVAPANLLPQSGLSPAAYLKGTAGLSVAIDLPLTGNGDARRHPAIDLKLDASSTAIELPAPFAKAAGVPAALFVHTEFREKAVHADVDYAGWLDGKLRFESGALERGDIRFYGGKPKLPAAAGVLLSGRVDELNVDQWLALSPAGTTGAVNPLQRLELKTRKLTYLKRTLDNAVLQLTQKSQHWVAALESEFLTGSVAIPKQGISAPGLAFNLKYGDFDRLLKESPLGGKQLVPADIPSFRLDAETILLNGWTLKQLKLEADVDAVRQVLKSSVNIADPDVGLQGTAEWRIDKRGGQRTETSLAFNSGNIGRGLGAFGYAEIVREGSGTAKFDLAWPAAPHKFDLGLMAGDAQISLNDGQVLEIEPGGGRLFGLLSVQTIPRRLAFDFKDIFSEGFRFDKMRGNFEFSEGNAHTDDYYIDGPAGRIDIKGRVGMVQRDYDQRVVFRPDLSSSLPIVGTLLGGTGTGLALILADRVARLFGKQADDLARLEYTLTGSWDDPVMTIVKQQNKKAKVKAKGKSKDK